MDEVTPTQPAPDRPAATAGPAPAPRPPASAPPPPTRSASTLLPLIALLAVGVLWLRTESQISQLREANRRLSQDVGALREKEMIDVAGAPALGGEGPVTLVEFSDYECPFCVRHFKQTMPEIEANFIKPGRIRYIFRDFPIDELHPEAIRAHETARCALEQNQSKYWMMHRALFSAPGTHKPEALEALARQTGLDVTALQGCVASGRVTAAIRRSGEIASSLGAAGTPAFFVGLLDRGAEQVRVLEAIKGAHPYSVFEQAITRALDQAK